MMDNNEFLGRGDLVALLWGELERRSVLMSGPRRIGKTALLKHMVAHPGERWAAVRIDMEGLESAEAAVHRITMAMKEAGLFSDTFAQALEKPEEVGLAGVASIKLRARQTRDPWEQLSSAVADVIANLAAQQKRLLLALDEVPWLLDGIQRTHGREAARLTLSNLRYLRQREDLSGSFRMILTGSIGLAGLARSLDASAEINDIQPLIDVPPLSESAGRSLFELEVTLRGQACQPAAAVLAHHIAGGSPHWIKTLASRAASTGGAVTEDTIEQAVLALLHPRMRHLFDDEGRQHLIKRYGVGQARQMAAMLDAADATAPVSEHALISAAMLTAEPPSRRHIASLLHVLVDEYYLTAQETPEGRLQYTFLNPLFQRWWHRYGGNV